MTTVASLADTPRTIVPLAPHQAIYELRLADRTDDIASADGRIAMALKSETCGVYKLDYRFVARFQQEQEITQTDQQTVSTENVAGTEFDFSTKTFVDGTAEKEVVGEARQDGNATKVVMTEPEERSFALPLSRFPMQHTRELIEKAKAGQQIVEARLFDGDDDSEKLLTSTAIISAHEPAAATPEAAKPEDAAAAARQALQAGIRSALAGLRSWRVSEAYYNSDSDPDGLPVFRTSYVLYENGVSDELKLDFGDYVFAGSLSKLDLLDLPKCP
ncbi:MULTISPECIES: EipB family protein [unclassified Aureimonas]|uniref:EipB family protein n=1 Tax=unclassified Aureimonas TaxID=2615206 RepID=UPI0006F82A3D|nr:MULTISPECIES: DUF1849 family protein [unclassified Aureimonas]KQT60308.1 hypothetical protein ASG62_06480 [Aureimonas sp. Leaf427]KQT79184.1 hypothetical protein ASG54_09075 [Aureimonas sp. Leaf460]